MPRVGLALALHRLHVDPLFVPVKQRKTTFSEEKNLAIRKEVASLLKAEAIHELQFPNWIANIGVLPEDEDKVAFITEYGLYCWRRMVNPIFEPHIRHNMEIYVYDMLVKRKVRGKHLENLRETLTRLRESKLKLNPEKCSLGVTSGKFLCYMINERGIESNPDKIKSLLEMKPPNKFLGYIQKLTRCLVALRRFISKSGERNLPFFKNLRKASPTKKIHWDDECNKAFEDLK
ncbi:hypothetical protein LIER_14851 [Lithospermum erythrorhizon]|uniref:Reverse transcriptase domain-containing protein n=1 Tax=Lithospermum erythrorhizon TaxID=34254 RepID=A0AAV3Q360_LITER